MNQFISHIKQQLADLKKQGLYKSERELTSPQGHNITTADGDKINMCANNYLGLANHPKVREVAKDALNTWGNGLASVRFICGTQSIHKQLEQRISQFLQMPATIVYPSCFDANGGLFETLLGPEDAVISDQLNHASIIDGIRLCKAKRYRYNNCDMQHLEQMLKQATKDGARHILITSDGVFSMDGYITPLPEICRLAKQYNALVHIDECHATGVIGKYGMGTHEYHNCIGQVDIITGTLGKALGGASGGFTCAAPEIVDWLRQKSRPYLFSNSLAPSIASSAICAIDLLQNEPELLKKLNRNADFLRNQLSAASFDILEGNHPIIALMLYDATVASDYAQKLNDLGVYVSAFTFPVVPQGRARIRMQVSASHSIEQLQFVVEQLKVIRGQ